MQHPLRGPRAAPDRFPMSSERKYISNGIKCSFLLGIPPHIHVVKLYAFAPSRLRVRPRVRRSSRFRVNHNGHSFRSIEQGRSAYLCPRVLSIALIQKGGGTGPVKPWQPSSRRCPMQIGRRRTFYDRCQIQKLLPLLYSAQESNNTKMSRDQVPVLSSRRMHLIRLSGGVFLCPPKSEERRTAAGHFWKAVQQPRN